MELLPPLLVLFIFSDSGFSQDCQPATLPELPSGYQAELQYNIAGNPRDRFSLRSCRLRGNCSPSSRYPVHEMGYSVNINERAEGRFARVDTFSEFQDSETGEQRLIKDTITWNPEISGISRFVFTRMYGIPPTETTCLVDSMYNDTVVEWLLGLNPDCSLGNSTNNCGTPTV